jgi:hypothetical protein
VTADPFQKLWNQYREAAGEGAVVELKLRLLAGKIPALEKFAHQQRLENIEAEIVNYFGQFLSAEEKETLRLCRQLRNEVLHSDFCEARKKLSELGAGAGTTRGNVVALRLYKGSAVTVAETSTTDAGGIFGWFLEAGTSGDFERAADAFKKAGGIIDRLAWVDII